MPWHIRSIEQKCKTCDKRATHELFNRMNAASGYYCRRCGTKAVEIAERAEGVNERRSLLFRRQL
jgi:uncharacterized Zn finger protein